MNFLLVVKKYASLIGGFFLVAITLGFSLKYKKAIAKSEKLEGENEVLRGELSHEKQAKSALENYAKAKEEQAFQAQKKLIEREKKANEDKDTADFLDTAIPAKLREKGAI